MSPKLKMFILTVITLFIALPIIMPVQNLSESVQKEDVFYERENSLPVYSNGNVVNKYINRLKKFYNFGKDSSNKQVSINKKPSEMLAQRKIRNISDNAATAGANDFSSADDSELFFAEDDDISADITTPQSSGYNFGDGETVNLTDGTVLTTDNLILKPTKEGYFYNGKFFKNGTYPKFANRNYVEGALNRYHSAAADKMGKKAVYFKGRDGNLTVDYVSQLPTKKANNANRYKAISAQEDTLLASNKFRDAYNRYRGARISGKQSNMAGMDVATASLYDMHSAYDLLQSQIANRSFTINLSNALTNSINDYSDNNSLKEFFKGNGNSNIEIVDKPNTPETPPAPVSDTLTIVIGGENFSEEYAYDVHDVGCSTGDMFTRTEALTYHIAEQMHDNPHISIELGTCKEPLEVTPSANIVSNISQNQELATLREQIKNIAKQNEQTTINIVSTDRTIAPMVRTLDEEQTITNNKGEFVRIAAVSPKEDESNLANVMGGITTNVIEEQDKAEELNNILNEYYLTSNLKPTNTMLAYQAWDNNVFVVTDPSNSYWIKNPKQVNTYQQQYYIKDGVYYQGVIIPTQDIMEMANKDRTNFLLVSDNPREHILPNGSVFITVKEEDVNMHSFNSQTIMQNTERVRDITKKGDATRLAPNANRIFKDLRNKNQEIPQNFDPEGKRTINLTLDDPNRNNNQEERPSLRQQFLNLLGI